MQRTSPPPRQREPARVFGILLALYLAVAIVIGGSSAYPLTADMLQLVAAPLLAVAIWRMIFMPRAPDCGAPLIILLAALGLALIQLAPLPPDIWLQLPGRETVLAGYEAAGMPLPWLPISLTPDATWRSILGLVPPAAVLIGVFTLDALARQRLALTVAAVAVGSVVVGMLQLSGGPESTLRPYLLSDTAAAVGFFANRNHQGVFLAACLPWAGLLAMLPAGRRGPVPLVWVSLAFLLSLTLILGAVVSRSRAGVILLVPGLIAAAVILLRLQGGLRRLSPRLLLAAGASGAVLLAAMIVLAFNFAPLASRFESGLKGELRLQLIPTVVQAGRQFAPTGSGVGSFEAVYPMFETPQKVMSVFVNHAHNEYAEIWLECGLAGLALIVAFCLWWVIAARDAFRSGDDVAAALAIGGGAMILLFLIHSLVDYPLRTPALANVFALACGLMTEPPRGGELRTRDRGAGIPPADARAMRRSTIRPRAGPFLRFRSIRRFTCLGLW